MIGTRLFHFRIIEKLGEGGMGVVYRAEDERLRRLVALKVLPPELVASEERRLRFLREARAAAAVAHPNIAVIHEVGEAEGVLFIAMELVEGKTLRDLMGGRPLPLKDALRIASEVAEGLAKAHQARVIHRDLKPDNIMVGPEGHAKILDFGLAKLREDRPQLGEVELSKLNTISGEITRAGKVLGTAAYMSPEQARGQPVDARSDIFSFGTTLYEMVTGQVPFRGKTSTDVLSAILRDEPVPPSRLSAGVPAELERIIGECLEKDPAERYQHADQLTVDLRKLRRVTDSGAQAARTPEAGVPSATDRVPARPRVKWLRHALALAGALAASAALLAVFLASPAPPRITGYTQLTRSQVFFPPYPSPFPLVTDGSRIYLEERISGQLLPRQIAIRGGETVPLTSPFPANFVTQVLDLTPDGSHFLVLVFEPGTPEGTFWLLPVVGSSPRRLGDVVGHQAIWSPDGSQILYVNGPELHLARRDGTEPRKLLTGPGRASWPRVSPDASRIRFTAFDPKSGLTDLWEASADGTDLRPLLPGWNDPPNQCCGSWTPDGKYYVFQATREHRSHLWAIREKAGLFSGGRSEPMQLTTGPMEFIRPLVGSDGKKIFAIGWQLRGELARYDAKSGQFVPYLSSLSAEELDFSRDGGWVTYVTYPEADLWRSRADGTDRLQLTFPPIRASTPDWSPDAETIAFEGQLPGQHWKIYLVPAAGGAPRPLTPEDRPEFSPSWSPDGKSLAFSPGGEGGVQIFDLESGKATEVAGSEGVRGPDWSPNGQYLAAHSTDHRRLLLFDLASRRWKVVAEIEVKDQYWSRDGEYLYIVSPFWLGPLRSVHRVRIQDGRLERVVSLKDVRQTWGVSGLWVGVTPDGAPLLLRDLSIHHIYALDWEP